MSTFAVCSLGICGGRWGALLTAEIAIELYALYCTFSVHLEKER
jgi:hypothetical protein